MTPSTLIRKSWPGVAALMVASALAASSGGATALASPKSSTITLTEQDYLCSVGAPSCWLNTIFPAYHKTHPNVVIKRTVVAGPVYTTHILEQASTGALPDILMMDNPDLPDLASTGALAPLSACHLNTSIIEPAELREGTYNGTFYGLPLIQASTQLIYNTQMLKAAHLSPPKTWAQLVSDAKALTTPSHFGIAFAAQPTPGNASWQFEPFLWSNGGQLYNLSAKPAVQALTLWTTLVKDGSASKDVVNWTQTTVADQFAAHRAAMMINGPWEIPALNQVKGLDYGTASIPTRTRNQTLIVPIGGELWTIPKTNPSAQRAACGVLKYMESPKVVKLDALSSWEVPVIKTAVSQVKQQQGPKMAPYYAETLHARARTESLGKDSLGPKYPRVSTTVGRAIDAALTGQESPAAAFASAAAQVSAILKG